MAERIFGMSFKLDKGKFTPSDASVVGKVDKDGKIQGTDYQFQRGIKGGIAMSANTSLIELEDGSLFNPATQEVFEPTKSGSGYFNPVSKTFIKRYG